MIRLMALVLLVCTLFGCAHKHPIMICFPAPGALVCGPMEQDKNPTLTPLEKS